MQNNFGLWLLGDQLSLEMVQDQIPIHCPILIIESLDYVKQRRYHRQKLVLVWSAMRHFARELEQAGYSVTYAIADDFLTPLQTWIKTHKLTEIKIFQPNDRPFQKLIESLKISASIFFLPNPHFLWTQGEFKTWASQRKRLIMEDFYREGRRRFNILMDGKKPIGGAWNYDKENRQPVKGKINPPQPLQFKPDEITQTVIEKVKSLEIPLYGDLETFHWGVNRTEALLVLTNFIEFRLPNFGTYQDAMVSEEETMWHSLISPYLNLGLLHPLEVIKAAEKAYFQKELPLNSVEGFIRQVLGWREYLHSLYHWVDESYFQSNYFNHHHPLPAFFWDAEQTNLNCLKQVLKQVEKTGYAHHIQRLMILSNFGLIAGISPQELEQWFHGAFIDSYDWVMQTNVLGMGVFADGGILASKPYAASANYIKRMSNYCQGCCYDPKQKLGEKACPFNFLYWDFLARHREILQSQGRMSFILANLDKMSESELQEICDRAACFQQESRERIM